MSQDSHEICPGCVRFIAAAAALAFKDVLVESAGADDSFLPATAVHGAAVGYITFAGELLDGESARARRFLALVHHHLDGLRK